MALNNNRLGDAWVDSIVACMGFNPGASDLAKLRTLMRAMAQDVITEFIDNAELQSDGNTEAHAIGGEADIIALPGNIVA